MNRYYRYILFYCLTFFFISCSSVKYQSHQKAFAKEDELIMRAIAYESSNDIEKANNIYDTLYKKSSKKEYALKNATLYLNSKKYEKANIVLLELYDNDKKDEIVLYLLSESYLQSKDGKNALFYSKQLLKIKKSEKNYLLVANSYIISSEFKSTLQYLEKTYSYNKNVDVLDKMVNIMYLIDNDKKKAISYLESHLRLYSFNKIIADKLVLFYKEQNNINGVISMYKRLHKRFPDKGYVYELINLFIAINDKKSLVKFLGASNVPSSVFKQIHGFINNPKTSFDLTKKMYKKTKDINFLAQSLMFEYEYLYQKKKLSNHKIKNIHNGFKKVLKKSPNPNYFNYVGYILIEHNVNVEMGVSYVQKALEINPKSPFYLDSLAWGYYKLKKYQEAYKTMKKVILVTGLDNADIRMHWETIKKSIEKQTKKKKIKKK